MIRLSITDSSLDEMRQLIKHTCWGASLQQSFDSIIVVSYNRARLGQTGTGHFSPIGAYNEQSDMGSWLRFSTK